jgi:hypothetical protein
MIDGTSLEAAGRMRNSARISLATAVVFASVLPRRLRDFVAIPPRLPVNAAVSDYGTTDLTK